MKKNTLGMDFLGIFLLHYMNVVLKVTQKKKKKMEQKIFQVINDSVQMKSVKKESVCWLK